MPAQSAFKAALQRRQYANRPSLVPLLQLTDRFNGSITAALNVLLSTDLATFLIGLSGLESPLLSLLQQYILAPPGTRGTTDELCALMNQDRIGHPMFFIRDLIIKIQDLLNYEQKEELKDTIYTRWYCDQSCPFCSYRFPIEKRYRSVLELPSVDMNNQPIKTVGEALEVYIDKMKRRVFLNQPCPAGCPAKRLIRYETATNHQPPKILILCLPYQKIKAQRKLVFPPTTTLYSSSIPSSVETNTGTTLPTSWTAKLAFGSATKTRNQIRSTEMISLKMRAVYSCIHM